ncbi:TreTu family toxin [Bacteroides luti]
MSFAYFVTTGGADAFTAAAKGSVYAEFQVPTSSLLQGGQVNWFKVIVPNADRAMQNALLKQVKNLSPILQIK